MTLEPPPTAIGRVLATVSAHLDEALTTLRMLQPAITATTASDVWPHEPPEPGSSLYHTLHHELAEAKAQIYDLRERLADQPRWKFLNGYLLSKEEFHALGVDGITWPDRSALGLDRLGALSDFELYLLFHYEDDQWRGLINPSESPHASGRVGARLGRPPEEICRAALRPEQRRFFAEYLPTVFARFL